ncbi:cytochrome P450 family protein [Streptosporangium carneum]|uniref:Cytochrome P450 n=1 Tax=Streptosporangium carneum TaxID=47481 RepID=A0A9W6HWT1_9ACTN|nr:cytochrome P450 [Streptosporangium carneum]GLK07028.1 cytochrome P450 [Streptosporangium carneum]
MTDQTDLTPSFGLTDDPHFMADPYPSYARWRQDGPVRRTTTPDGTAVWLVTRYADVRAALNDPRLSLNRKNSGGGYGGFRLPPALDTNLLNMDPPDHTRIRRLVSKAFTARRVEGLRPRIQEITGRLLDAVAPVGRADLMAALAVPLPITVIGELLGVPSGDRERFRSWTTTLIAPDPGEPALAREAVGQMSRLLARLVADKRAEPADDLISAMIAARDEEDRLGEEEMTSLAFLILWAGYEATVHLIGNGILTLLRHPAWLAAVRDDPRLTPSVVEEVLRFVSPTPYAIRRFAVEDVTVGGVTIPSGETVLLSLACAHHDESVFFAPESFAPGPRENSHLAFGHGVHYCLGAPLARAEAQIAIGTLVRRLPGLAPATPVEELRWQPSFRSHGLLELPVTFSVAGSAPSR